MSTEALKTMKEQLMSCVQGQLGNIAQANAHELGEAVDMIKDLAEAIYYCTITDSMEKADEISKERNGDTNINYYTIPDPVYRRTNYYHDPDEIYYRDMERKNGYMYYTSGNSSNGSSNMGNGSNNSSMNTSGRNYYTENDIMRDPREGRSPMRRRMYMEGKEAHSDKNTQLRELEAYLQELSTDITEMIRDASPEEKTTLREKMTMLASKIA